MEDSELSLPSTGLAKKTARLEVIGAPPPLPPLPPSNRGHPLFPFIFCKLG